MAEQPVMEQSDQIMECDASMPDANVAENPDATDEAAPAETTDNEAAASNGPAADQLNPEDDVSTSSSGTKDTEDNSGDRGTVDPSAALLEALQHKESGNAHFASSDHIEATRSYRKGINLLKPLNKQNTGDDQVKSLLVSLNTNLSMVCYKQSKWKLSRDAASKALEVDGINVKALYRRALAHRALGDDDAALIDLKKAYKLDEKNAAVKKEMASLRKERETKKADEKARMQKAFSLGSLLYGDKEEEEKRAAKRREKEAKEREEREAKERERRKKEWEDDCVKRLSEEKEVLSFEDWETERTRIEEEEKKEKERVRKEEEKKRREERKAARKEKQPESDSEDELTEKELAMLRGYKKTSDGRTTSYFTREQTEKEKELIGCIQPKRLESSASSATSEQAQSNVGSVWNQAGITWEEKDTTDWSKSTLKECLLEAIGVHSNEFGTYIAQVKEVDSLTGDASVALAGGKKRYIYDFHTDLKYEIVNEEKDCVASGSLRLPDINSAHTAEEELEVDVLKWKKRPEGELVGDAEVCRDVLVGEVRKSVLRFVERFNANF
jgi:tetratricopeptide (TPR) repeat protein